MADSPSPVLFETKRLFAREFTETDVEAVFAYSGSAENTEFMDWGPENHIGVVRFVQSRLSSQIAENRTVYDLALCLKSTGELIGSAGLTLDESREQGELGYILHRAHWRRGYAAEAARGFLRFGFLGLDLHRIHARCDTENAASRHVMESIGMRREAHFKSSRRIRVRQKLQWRSEYVYAMLQTEYLKTLPDGIHSADRE